MLEKRELTLSILPDRTTNSMQRKRVLHRVDSRVQPCKVSNSIIFDPLIEDQRQTYTRERRGKCLNKE